MTSQYEDELDELLSDWNDETLLREIDANLILAMSAPNDAARFVHLAALRAHSGVLVRRIEKRFFDQTK